MTTPQEHADLNRKAAIDAGCTPEQAERIAQDTLRRIASKGGYITVPKETIEAWEIQINDVRQGVTRVHVALVDLVDLAKIHAGKTQQGTLARLLCDEILKMERFVVDPSATSELSDGAYIGYLEGEIDIHVEKCERCRLGEACAAFDSLRDESNRARGTRGL